MTPNMNNCDDKNQGGSLLIFRTLLQEEKKKISLTVTM